MTKPSSQSTFNGAVRNRLPGSKFGTLYAEDTASKNGFLLRQYVVEGFKDPISTTLQGDTLDVSRITIPHDDLALVMIEANWKDKDVSFFIDVNEFNVSLFSDFFPTAARAELNHNLDQIFVNISLIVDDVRPAITSEVRQGIMERWHSRLHP